MKESKRSVSNLDETIHSLLGLKARLTPSWVDSVSRIVRNLHSRGPRAALEPAKSNSKARILSAAEEVENHTVISKLNGM